MKGPRKPRQPTGEYEVGYGRPPAATRFQPGQSGNPKGRKKGVKSVAAALIEALSAKVTVQVNGKPHTMTMQEAMVKGLVSAAVRQQLPAIRTVFELQQRLLDVAELEPPGTDALSPDDAEIMRRMLERHGVTGTSADPAAEGEAPPDARPAADTGRDREEG